MNHVFLAQLSDLHITTTLDKQGCGINQSARRLEAAVTRLLDMETRPCAILLSGDLVQTGDCEEYALLRSFLPIDIPIIAVPGNHDCPSKMREMLGTMVPDAYPSLHAFSSGEETLFVVAMNTAVAGEEFGEVDSEHVATLRLLLDRCAGAPTIVMLHHPTIPCGVGVLDDTRLIDSPELFCAIKDYPNVVAILAGHYHRAMFGMWCDRPMIVCPSIARPLATAFASGKVEYEPGECAFLLHRWHSTELLSYVVQVPTRT